MSVTGKSKVLGKRRKYWEEEQEEDNQTELLPKLPNDITVDLICTKLPWRTFHVLSSVSRAWLGAIRSGKVSDARVSSGTTETLAVLECTFPDSRQCAMALYSLRDKAIYRLPTCPRSQGRTFPSPHCRWITAGGKVYILQELNAEVWVFDVAGQKKWQKCASRHTTRYNFECAVFEGKIYVFGGRTPRRPPFALDGSIGFSEVFDPKLENWTKIHPLKFWRSKSRVWTGAVGDEILVDAGEVCQQNYGSFCINWRPIERSKDGMVAYNPTKDSWRTIPPGDFGKQALQVVGSEKLERENLFTAHGRLHSVSRGKISVIDLDKKSVEGLHKCSFKTRYRNKYLREPLCPEVLFTNEGLLIKGHLNGCPGPYDECRLYQSSTVELGFGKKKILFEEVEFSPSVSFFHFSPLLPIQL